MEVVGGRAGNGEDKKERVSQFQEDIRGGVEGSRRK